MAGFYGHALSVLVKMCATERKYFKILLKIDSFCVSCFVCVIHSFFRGNKYLTGGLWWKRLAFGGTIWLIFDNWWRILVLPPLCLKTFETNQVSTKLLIKALRKVWSNGGMAWVGGGLFISRCGWVNRGEVLSHSLFLFKIFICAFVFWSVMSCLFFKWVEHDSCCVCFFVYYLFSLSPVPLTRSYLGIEIVASVM